MHIVYLWHRTVCSETNTCIVVSMVTHLCSMCIHNMAWFIVTAGTGVPAMCVVGGNII